MVKKKGKIKMILITVHLTEQQVKMLEKLVEMRIFPNRSEAIRVAIRDLLDKYFYSRRQNYTDIITALA